MGELCDCVGGGLCDCVSGVTSSSVCVSSAGFGLDRELYFAFCNDSMYSMMLCRRGRAIGWLMSAAATGC